MSTNQGWFMRDRMLYDLPSRDRQEAVLEVFLAFNMFHPTVSKKKRDSSMKPHTV
jgi:hypothetical protein